MRRHLVLPLTFTMLFVVSCAPRVSILRIKPAKYKIEAVRTIGILPLATSASENLSGGEYITEALYKSLVWRKFFKEVKHVAPRNKLNYHQIKDMPASQAVGLCREANVDALVKGDVFAFHVAVDDSLKRIEREEGTGQYRNVTRVENGQRKTERVEIMKKVVEEVPVVNRKAEVGFVLDVANAREKRWIDHERFYKSKKQSAEGKDNIAKLPTEDLVLNELAGELIAQATDSFVPHTVAEKRTLAKDKTCKEGITLAKKGDWNGALSSWKNAISFDPQNDAAIYNTGVAYEAMKDYMSAREAYESAAALADKKPYKEAIKNVDDIISDEAKLKNQMKGRNR